MTSRIKILPDQVINKIAAGEVVDRPASVVKELIENALDASASEILIDIEQAGTRLIRVADNGFGMSKDDAYIAFERHATSKIASDADLESIRTMGFRGEALSSIAAVSQVRLRTSEQGAPSGIFVEIAGGQVKKISDAAATRGTTLEVSHLFYNTPARLKFLKSPATEFSHIVTAVSRQALANPSIRFKLVHNTRDVLDIPPSQNAKERLVYLYGRDLAENVLEFTGNNSDVLIAGLVGRPAYTRADRTYQDFFVNCRAVRNVSLTHALYSAYGDMLMHDRHPVGFIFIVMDPALVDVNVHPAKAEVRFRNQSQIHDMVRYEIRECLRKFGSPQPDASETSYAYRERVKSASEDFLKGASSEVDTNRERKPFVAYGRRKNDMRPSESREVDDDLSDVQAAAALASQQSLLPESVVRPLGQIHDSFIIAQSHDGMAMIDQHAAHERVLFEQLQDQFANGAILVQDLLIPLQVELGPSQGDLLLEHLAELGKFGFIVEGFGGNSFIIKGIPFLLVGADYKKILLDILDEVISSGHSGRIIALRDKMLSVMACHPSIKVNRHLDAKEMESLLSSLLRCRMPHTCPHGRPTVVRFSMIDLKKLFKRL